VPSPVPGTRTLTFRNDGEQDHSLAVAEFPDGVDAGAAQAAFGAFLAAPPPTTDRPTTFRRPTTSPSPARSAPADGRPSPSN